VMWFAKNVTGSVSYAEAKGEAGVTTAKCIFSKIWLPAC